MANERKTVVTYKGDGSQKSFTFPFDYLRKSFVKVMIDGVEQTYGIDYTVNSKQLDFSVAPANNVVIVIYRETSTDRLVAWEDASVLRASDMTLFEVQLLHIAEETQDKVQDSGLAKDDYDGVWDGRLARIKNVLDPVYALDVVNKQYFESVQAGYIQANQALVNEATSQKNQATTQAQNAATSASKALTSENNAKSSETKAKTSETNAKTSETKAASSAALASSKVIEATNEANRSRDEANRAKSEADRSRDEANRSYSEAERARVLTEGVIVPAPSIPVGIPFPWFSDVFPDGTLECNGQSFNASTYPELAKVYPSGVLPDLRGVVLRGLDRGRGLDLDGAGRTVGSYQADEIKAHNHAIPLGSGDFGSNRPEPRKSNAGTGYTLDTGGTETRMKNVACYWLVYAIPAVAYDMRVEGGNAATLGGYPASYFRPKQDKVYKSELAPDVYLPDYDSGWQYISSNVTITLNHNLGFMPLRVHLWASNRADGIPLSDSDYLIPIAPTTYDNGNYVTNLVFLDNTVAKIRGGSSGLWSFKTANGTPANATTGYVRLVMYR